MASADGVRTRTYAIRARTSQKALTVVRKACTHFTIHISDIYFVDVYSQEKAKKRDNTETSDEGQQRNGLVVEPNRMCGGCGVVCTLCIEPSL